MSESKLAATARRKASLQRALDLLGANVADQKAELLSLQRRVRLLEDRANATGEPGQWPTTSPDRLTRPTESDELGIYSPGEDLPPTQIRPAARRTMDVPWTLRILDRMLAWRMLAKIRETRARKSR